MRFIVFTLGFLCISAVYSASLDKEKLIERLLQELSERDFVTPSIREVTEHSTESRRGVTEPSTESRRGVTEPSRLQLLKKLLARDCGSYCNMLYDGLEKVSCCWSSFQ